MLTQKEAEAILKEQELADKKIIPQSGGNGSMFSDEEIKSMLRQNGVSIDDITSQKQVPKSLEFVDKKKFDRKLVDSFIRGLRRPNELLYGDAKSVAPLEEETKDEGLLQSFARSAGQLVSDIPAMTVGSLIAGPAGAMGLSSGLNAYAETRQGKDVKPIDPKQIAIDLVKTSFMPIDAIAEHAKDKISGGKGDTSLGRVAGFGDDVARVAPDAAKAVANYLNKRSWRGMANKLAGDETPDIADVDPDVQSVVDSTLDGASFGFVLGYVQKYIKGSGKEIQRRVADWINGGGYKSVPHDQKLRFLKAANEAVSKNAQPKALKALDAMVRGEYEEGAKMMEAAAKISSKTKRLDFPIETAIAATAPALIQGRMPDEKEVLHNLVLFGGMKIVGGMTSRSMKMPGETRIKNEITSAVDKTLMKEYSEMSEYMPQVERMKEVMRDGGKIREVDAVRAKMLAERIVPDKAAEINEKFGGKRIDELHPVDRTAAYREYRDAVFASEKKSMGSDPTVSAREKNLMDKLVEDVVTKINEEYDRPKTVVRNKKNLTKAIEKIALEPGREELLSQIKTSADGASRVVDARFRSMILESMGMEKKKGSGMVPRRITDMPIDDFRWMLSEGIAEHEFHHPKADNPNALSGIKRSKMALYFPEGNGKVGVASENESYARKFLSDGGRVIKRSVPSSDIYALDSKHEFAYIPKHGAYENIKGLPKEFVEARPEIQQAMINESMNRYNLLRNEISIAFDSGVSNLATALGKDTVSDYLFGRGKTHDEVRKIMGGEIDDAYLPAEITLEKGGVKIMQEGQSVITNADVKGLSHSLKFAEDSLRKGAKIPLTNMWYFCKKYGLMDFYRAVRSAYSCMAQEREKVNGQMKEWMSMKGINKKTSGENITLYAYGKNPETMAFATELGYKIPEKLTVSEMYVYEQMSASYERMLLRINSARAINGLKPIGEIENYAPIQSKKLSRVDSMNFLDRVMSDGFDLTKMPDREIKNKYTDFYNKRIAVAKETNLVHGKERKYKVVDPELDALNLYENYMNSALRHVYITPTVGKMSTMLKIKTYNGHFMDFQTLYPTAYGIVRDLTDYMMRGARSQESVNALSEFAYSMVEKLSSNVALSMIAYNAGMTLNQFTGYVNSLLILGPNDAIYGINKMLTATKAERESAMNKSEVLKQRLEGVFVDVYDIAKKKKTIVGKARQKFMVDAGTWFVKAADYAVAYATFEGAYNKAIKHGTKVGLHGKELEKYAVRFADDAIVRTQASTMPIDRAPLQRGRLGRIATTFGNYGIANWNFLKSMFGKDAKYYDNPYGRATSFVMYSIASVGLEAIYEGILDMESPLPSPISTYRRAKANGKTDTHAMVMAGIEFSKVRPLLGGALRYGSSPLGPLAEQVVRVVRGAGNPQYASEVPWSMLTMTGALPISTIKKIARSKDESVLKSLISGRGPTKEERNRNAGFKKYRQWKPVDYTKKFKQY